MRLGAAEPTSEDLVARANLGDRDAFGQLYDRLAPDVHRFLVGLRLGLDHHRIEDAVQEAFVRLHGLLGTFQSGRSLRPFLLGIARRVALEIERRGRIRRTKELDGEAVASPADEPPANALLRSERDEGVGRAMVALRQELRALIVFRFVNEMTMQEIAEALECSVPTARERLREAVAAFLSELTKAGITAEDASL